MTDPFELQRFVDAQAPVYAQVRSELRSGRKRSEILGSPDDLNFRSSMTRFKAVSGDPVFRKALDTFCAGKSDPATMTIPQKQSPLEGSKT